MYDYRRRMATVVGLESSSKKQEEWSYTARSSKIVREAYGRFYFMKMNRIVAGWASLSNYRHSVPIASRILQQASRVYCIPPGLSCYDEKLTPERCYVTLHIPTIYRKRQSEH